jgi:hypothetical protein
MVELVAQNVAAAVNAAVSCSYIEVAVPFKDRKNLCKRSNRLN